MIKTISFTAWLSVLSTILFQACQSEPTIPDAYTNVEQKAILYPDYTDITIPPNIAPLNFIIKEEAQSFIVNMNSPNGQLTIKGEKDGKIQIPYAKWKRLISANKGDSVSVTIYAKTPQGWTRYPAYMLYVAREYIDPYLSYRLIEPGYELYRQLGLYQRNLTNFDIKTIYENNRSYEDENNHCINCHNYQNYDTRRMLFHIRANHGGTIIAENGNIQKMKLQSDSILSSAVYPSWHPTQNWIVFSSNKTGQSFHVQNPEKVEVVDTESDLIFYDTEKKTISNILRTDDVLENFPCWHPNGRKLFYCSVGLPNLKGSTDAERRKYILSHYNNIRYNLMSMDFNPITQTFSHPRMELNCDSLMQKSASVPRVSPDGRYLLFTLGDYGQFHIWHKSADLFIMDLRTKDVWPLTQANSNDVESYHSWSSNGRWIVFSSRRDDGSYTRPYFAYIDENGKDRKAFMLPQEDPEQNLFLLKSYNVPELTKNAVPYNANDFKQVIYQTDGAPVKYLPR